MAEPTQSPALPSTADAVPYVPISWTAVAAVGVAGLFAVLLLLLGLSAFTNKKPLLMQELLVLPVIAVVLSFAARRMIRNSEGTRTGEQLANGAWWTALVLGLGYVAYLLGIDYSVRRDAGTEVQQWMELVREEKMELAFYKTIPPGSRQGIAKNDTVLLRARFRDELLAFGNSDLMKLAQRNPGEFTFVPVGVSEWVNKSGTIDCTYTGIVRCPEGEFPVVIPLKGLEGVTTSEGGGGGRQWMIVRPQGGGFIQQDRAERTSYGWLLPLIEFKGNEFGKVFTDHVAYGPSGHQYLFRAFVVPGADGGAWAAIVRSPLLHMVFSAPLGIAQATQPGAYPRGIPDNFFKLPGGGEPSSGQKAKFAASWNAQGLLPAGTRLKDPAGGTSGREGAIKLTETEIEFHVPVELPLQSTGKLETARGRVVLVCTDPALLAELKQRRAAAKGEKPSASPPEDVIQLVRDRAIPWRVARIESDLVPVSIQTTATGGGPPGGGHGAGGHGDGG